MPSIGRVVGFPYLLVHNYIKLVNKPENLLIPLWILEKKRENVQAYHRCQDFSIAWACFPFRSHLILSCRRLPCPLPPPRSDALHTASGSGEALKLVGLTQKTRLVHILSKAMCKLKWEWSTLCLT